MPRPHPQRSRAVVEAPPRVPDRSLTPEQPLPTMAIRASGMHQFVYRKMVEGPVGAAAPSHGDLVRVVDRDGQHIGFALWNGRSQISLRFLSRLETPPGPEFWSRRIDEAVALRKTFLELDRDTNAYRVVHAEGDGLSGLIIDRYDDVLSVEIFSLGMYQRIGPILSLCAERLATTHFRVNVNERVALQEDFSGRALTTPQLPPRVTIHEHGVRYRIHFEEGHKTGFFCDQRDNRRELARFCADKAVLDLCCYTGGFGLNALVRGKAREVTCVDLDEKAVALARERQRQPGPAGSDPRRRIRLPTPDGPQWKNVRRDCARSTQADPGPRGNRSGQAKVLRPERDGDEIGRAGWTSPHLFLLRAAGRTGIPVSVACRGTQCGATRPASILGRCGGRPPGRARRPGGRLSQGRLAPGGRATLNIIDLPEKSSRPREHRARVPRLSWYKARQYGDSDRQVVFNRTA